MENALKILEAQIHGYRSCERKLLRQERFWQLLCELGEMLSLLGKNEPGEFVQVTDSVQCLGLLSHVAHLLSSLADGLEQCIPHPEESGC